MNNIRIIISCFICLTWLSVDALDLTFRYYDINGKIVSNPLEISSPTCSVYRVSNAENSGWQQWALDGFNGKAIIEIRQGNTVQELELDVLGNFQEKLKSLVINRIQFQGNRIQLKINHLTCKWTGGIAYPIEYLFNNPLDGNTLKLKSQSCKSSYDSLNFELFVLSDSVILFRCGDDNALFFKYYLAANHSFIREPSGYQCSDYHNEAEKQLYTLLTEPQRLIRYSYDGNKLNLFDGKCNWEFIFE
ncbi:MAG: hypothetical protein GC180_00240 [Bacteroidetes bacterium]|nr:hypothetical protein [Bacteroidota bacterium]